MAILLVSVPLHAKDSVLVSWDQLISKPGLAQRDIIAMALIAENELKILKLYIDVCQKQQPQNSKSYNKLSAHLSSIGESIITYNRSITKLQLSKFGINSENAAKNNYLHQKNEMPLQFPKRSVAQQQAFCSSVRNEVNAMSVKKSPAEL